MVSTFTRICVLVALFGLSGCETFQGLGRDLNSMGRIITGN